MLLFFSLPRPTGALQAEFHQDYCRGLRFANVMSFLSKLGLWSDQIYQNLIFHRWLGWIALIQDWNNGHLSGLSLMSPVKIFGRCLFFYFWLIVSGIIILPTQTHGNLEGLILQNWPIYFALLDNPPKWGGAIFPGFYCLPQNAPSEISPQLWCEIYSRPGQLAPREVKQLWCWLKLQGKLFQGPCIVPQ